MSPVQDQRSRRLQVGSGSMFAQIATVATPEIQLGVGDYNITTDPGC